MVSVSSSDRRGVQACVQIGVGLYTFVSVSSSDRRGVQVDRAIDFAPTPTMFQYPHRIVGGFKHDRPICNRGECECVSVSSSDRRGVQVGNCDRPLPAFDVSVSSSDRRGVQGRRPTPQPRCRSGVSVSSSDRRGVQGKYG